MKAEDFARLHCGHLVRDLNESMKTFAQSFGFEFNTPAVIPFTMKHGDDVWDQPTRAVFATNWIFEMVEVAPKGVFAEEIGFGLHHVGGVVADIDAAVEEQIALENLPEYELSYEGQLIAVFFKGTDAMPGRLELVNAKAPRLLEIFAEDRG